MVSTVRQVELTAGQTTTQTKSKVPALLSCRPRWRGRHGLVQILFGSAKHETDETLPFVEAAR
jgi:hypothetical protein